MHVVERPTYQRCWVVRASGGDYVLHFRQAGIVAIGHIDGLGYSVQKSDNFYPNLNKLRERIEASEKKKENRGWKYRAASSFNQTKTFIADITIGDLIVTIDHDKLSIGRVIGNPYLQHTPVTYYYDLKKDRSSEMPFTLRRAIQWGPVMKRGTLPGAMKRSITARQTVFNIDKYWTAIYHLLYPIFLDEENIYFSTNIRAKDEINGFNISQLFRVMAELEVVTQSFQSIAKDSSIDFDDLFESYLSAGEFHLKATAEFMSPGSVWSHVNFTKGTKKKLFIAALLYGALFGIKIDLFGTDVNIDGIIDKRMREELVEYFLGRLKENRADRMQQQLQLDYPRYNTKALEDASKDGKQDPKAAQIVEDYENTI